MAPTTQQRSYPTPLDWLLRNRESGRITIGQWPNLPLALYLGTLAVRIIFRPTADTATVLTALSAGLLLVWAALEVTLGVNPFRRFVGLAVAGSQVALLLLHF